MSNVKEVNITNNKCRCCGSEADATILDISICNKCMDLVIKYGNEILAKGDK